MSALAAALVALALSTAPAPIRVRLPFQSGGADSARAIVIAMARVVEGDSTARTAARWAARLRPGLADRPAVLALATLARLTYDAPRADSLYDRLLAPGPPADAFTAYAALGRAQMLANHGRIDLSASWFARAVAIARAARVPAARAEAAIGLAAMRGRTEGTAAESRLLDRLAAWMPHGDPRLEAAFICERAALRARTGAPDAAALARAGQLLAHRVHDRRLEARCGSALAQDDVRRGDLAAAGVALSRAQDLLSRAREHAGLAALLQWHGYLQVTLGNFGPAERLLTEAVREAQRSGNRSALAWALLDLSQISEGVRDLYTAEHQAARAESSFREVGDRWGLATALGLRAEAAAEVGDTAAARERYADLLRWAQLERQPLAVADARVGLADLRLRAGDAAGARRELDAARRAYRRAHATAWTAGLRYDYGTVALRAGRLAEAARDYRADLASLGAAQHGRRYLTQAALAEVALRRGDTLRAERDLREASDELDAWRATLGDRDLRVLAFQVRDAFGGRDPAVATIIAGIAASGRVGAAFELAERRRARALRNELARADALRASGPRPAAAARPTPPAVTATVVERAIPDARTALLEYVTGDASEPTTLFVITRDGARAYPVAPLGALAPRVERFDALIEAGSTPLPLARALGDALLGAALRDLPSGVRRLVIVPDGVLWRVPYQALAGADGTYLIMRYAVAITPGAAVATALWRRAPAPGPARLLAFGDPRYADSVGVGGDAGVRAAFASSGGLPPLPATAREVRRIARYAPEADLRLGRQASASWLEHASLGAYRVIHFATHAVVDAHPAAHSALALAPGAGSDGLVRAGDLAALHLDADLVVLSACRTAGGEVVGGEGLRGLTAPLLAAGARSVAATEWPVSDQRTVDLVGWFYDALARGEPTGDALRTAELRALRAGAPMREWAAFRLVGDPDVTVPLRAPRGLRGVLARWLGW